MINEQKDNLFQLIKSLTKSEKRQFKLYVGRMGSNNNAKFLSLFNFLDKLDKYSEKAILVKGIVTKQQLSNLKDKYTDLIVDGFDHKDMYRIVFDYLRSEMESVNEDELRAEIVDYYDEETYEGLIEESTTQIK